MRILHTSDWHLGRTLEGRSRLPEQREFVDQLGALAAEEGVDLVLVAGDVFDTYNPPAEAEQLLFAALERLAGGGQRAVVVVAGNHDSPDRVCAANPLARRHGIYLFGYPGQTLAGGGAVGRVACRAAGPGWVELQIGEETALVYALSYPSEARLKEVLSDEGDERARQAVYSERVGRLCEESASLFRTDTVNLIAGHLFTLGGQPSDSERDVSLGGALIVEPRVFPANAHYVALGHLHRPQVVGGSATPCRYSGSPLAYSFSEAGQQKQVVLVEARAGEAATVRPTPLTCGRPLKQWHARSVAEFLAWCAQPENLACWLDLEVEVEQPLSPAELADLYKRHDGLVSVRPIMPGAPRTEEEQRLSDLSLEERFHRFVQRQWGTDPPPELVTLFLSLVEEESGEDQPGEPGPGEAGERGGVA